HRECFAVEAPTDPADVDRQLVLMQNGRIGTGIRSHAGSAREPRAKANKAILESRHSIVRKPIHNFREPLFLGSRFEKCWIEELLPLGLERCPFLSFAPPASVGRFARIAAGEDEVDL